MNKDLAHLMKIVDRFSKIGSEAVLTPNSVNEVVGDTVMYFRKRIPRNVTLDYNGLATDTVKAKINVALFEWVVENLMKNAMQVFYDIRSLRDIRKKPSTSELIDWINALQIGGISADTLKEKMPFLGVVVKKDEDLTEVNKNMN